jgi:tetratricopeptide (TPR) repeat protein
MPELADRLTGLANKTAFAQDLLVEILNAGNYYEPEEIKVYVEAWQKYRKLNIHQRMKLKADGYLGYRRYIKAASIYDDIIDRQEEINDRVFLGNIYHNRAVAAASNLDIEDAKRFFLKAYELNQNPESLRSYFFVIAAREDTATLKQEMRKMDLDEEYFEDIMMEIGDSKDDVREMTIFAMLQRAVYNKMNKDMTDYDKRMDIILAQLKDEFREQAI